MWWVWKPQIKLYIHIQHLRLFQTMLNGESWEPRERCLPPRTCLPFLGLASTRPRSTSPTSTLPTDPSHGHPSKPPALPHSSREEFCFLFATLAPTAGEHLEARCKLPPDQIIGESSTHWCAEILGELWKSWPCCRSNWTLGLDHIYSPEYRVQSLHPAQGMRW